MSQNNVAVGLDIGTTKVTVLIGRINNDKTIKYTGIGECTSMGLRKGLIVDIDNTVKSIEQAINIAQKMAGVKVDSVYVNTIIEPTTNFQDQAIVNLIKAVNRLGVNIKDLVLGPVAAAEAVLNYGEKEKGAVLIDIGAGVTGIAVFQDNSLLYAGVLPIGGRHITSDLAFGLRVTEEEAEKVKLAHGCVLPELALEYDFIEVGTGKERRKVSRKLIANIIQPRVEEILNLAKKQIINNEHPAGNPIIVLTGGTSLLPGIQELTAGIFGWPVELASDEAIKRATQVINLPSYAVAVGLVRRGAQDFKPQETVINLNHEEGIVSKMKKWIREYI